MHQPMRLWRAWRTGAWVTLDQATKLSMFHAGELDRSVLKATRAQLQDSARLTMNVIDRARAKAK